ncbi:DUF721 domain-containing protein [bacterium]|nr:DUF721 domain-containing protein [bacterium]
MESIKSILNVVIGDIQKKQQQYPQEKIENIWKKCVKKIISQHTKASFFKKGKLYVNVENSAWLYELNTKKEDIVKRLKKISKNKIKELRLKIGDIYGN